MTMKRLRKTQAGLDAFGARSPLLTRRQRTAFLLCDGQRSMDAVLADTAVVGATAEDLEYMVAHGFLDYAPEVLPVSPPPTPTPPPAAPQPTEGRGPDVEHWTLF